MSVFKLSNTAKSAIELFCTIQAEVDCLGIMCGEYTEIFDDARFISDLTDCFNFLYQALEYFYIDAYENSVTCIKNDLECVKLGINELLSIFEEVSEYCEYLHEYSRCAAILTKCRYVMSLL